MPMADEDNELTEWMLIKILRSAEFHMTSILSNIIKDGLVLAINH